jgi:hypothetical protein
VRAGSRIGRARWSGENAGSGDSCCEELADHT